MPEEIVILSGGVSIDDRGEILYFNSVNLKKIKRFYVMNNHKYHFIRAWHAHKKESKIITVLDGTALICAVKIENWKNPKKNSKIFRKVLSSKNPQMIHIPKGYANGTMTLEKNTKLIFFSDSTLDQSKNDDYRYPFDYWNPWDIIQR